MFGFLKRAGRKVSKAAKEELTEAAEEVQEELQETGRNIVNIGRRRLRRVVRKSMKKLQSTVLIHTEKEDRETVRRAFEASADDLIDELLRVKK